jgi:hypothetical protein
MKVWGEVARHSYVFRVVITALSMSNLGRIVTHGQIQFCKQGHRQPYFTEVSTQLWYIFFLIC